MSIIDNKTASPRHAGTMVVMRRDRANENGARGEGQHAQGGDDSYDEGGMRFTPQQASRGSGGCCSWTLSMAGLAIFVAALVSWMADSLNPSYGQLVVVVPAGISICEVSAMSRSGENVPIKVVEDNVAFDGNAFTCAPSSSFESKHTVTYQKSKWIQSFYVRTTHAFKSGLLQISVDGLRFPDENIIGYQNVVSISSTGKAIYSRDDCDENALQIAEVKVDVSSGSGKLIAMSATSVDRYHPAYLATDGDINTFFSSANTPGATWSAGVLGAAVERIEIYPRFDRCQGGMDKIKVEVNGIDVTNSKMTAVANVLRFEQSVTWNDRGCPGEKAFIVLCNVQVHVGMFSKEMKLLHAQQVSTYQGRHASLATDGVVDGIPTKGHCAHTNQAKLAWWAAYFFGDPKSAKVTWSQRKENVVRTPCVDGRMWNTHVLINEKDVTSTYQNNWVRLMK